MVIKTARGRDRLRDIPRALLAYPRRGSGGEEVASGAAQMLTGTTRLALGRLLLQGEDAARGDVIGIPADEVEGAEEHSRRVLEDREHIRVRVSTFRHETPMPLFHGDHTLDDREMRLE